MSEYIAKYQLITATGFWEEEHWDFAKYFFDTWSRFTRCNPNNMTGESLFLEAQKAAVERFGHDWTYSLEELQEKHQDLTKRRPK